MSEQNEILAITPEEAANLEHLCKLAQSALKAEAAGYDARKIVNAEIAAQANRSKDAVISILRKLIEVIPTATFIQKGFGVKDALSLLSFVGDHWSNFAASRSVQAAWSREKKARAPKDAVEDAIKAFDKALAGLVAVNVVDEATAAELRAILFPPAEAEVEAEKELAEATV